MTVSSHNITFRVDGDAPHRDSPDGTLTIFGVMARRRPDSIRVVAKQSDRSPTRPRGRLPSLCGPRTVHSNGTAAGISSTPSALTVNRIQRP